MKLILIKNKYNNKDDDSIARSEYTQFENDQDHEIIDHHNNETNNKQEKEESSV